MTHVLLVENGPPQAAALSIIFEEAGFVLERCTDAQSALARLRAERFDLVLSAVRLPELSGFDLCKAIKGDLSTRDVPIMIVTDESDPSVVLIGLEAGADGFVTRNHSPEEFLARVRRALASPDDDTVAFQGRTFRLNIGTRQLRNLLVSAFEDGVAANQRLAEREAALRLVNQDLRKAEDELAHANAVKDKFLGAAAHDLRSPLAVIQGFASLISDGSLGEVNGEQIDALQRIGRAVDTMLSLLADLLDVSTPEGR